MGFLNRTKRNLQPEGSCDITMAGSWGKLALEIQLYLLHLRYLIRFVDSSLRITDFV